MAKIFQKGPAIKQSEQRKTNFEVIKTFRLGTRKAPAKVFVQTQEREQELATIFAENGWACVIEVNSEQDENIRDLEDLQKKQVRAVSTKKAHRNDPCPCGSGRKYKKCVGRNVYYSTSCSVEIFTPAYLLLSRLVRARICLGSFGCGICRITLCSSLVKV